MDLALGQDGFVTIPAFQADTGAPYLNASASITWSLYGPLSTTALTTDTQTNYYAGPGVYGWTIDKAFLTTPGLYSLEVTSSALGDKSLQRYPVWVGTVPPGTYRLRRLLESLCRGVGGSVRQSQAIDSPGAKTLVDDWWIFGGSGFDFRGSEIVVIDPATLANYADWRKGRVTTFDATTGTFTLNRGVSTGADTTGRHYLLCNVQGQGFSFERLVEELQVAWDEVAPTRVVSTSVALSSAANQLEYLVPPEFVSVVDVAVRDINAQQTDRWDSLMGNWTVQPDRRLLQAGSELGLDSVGYNFRLTGAIRAELPRTGGGFAAEVNGVWLRERARFGLLSSSPYATHQRAASAIYANLARQGNGKRRALPGEVWLG